MSSPRKSHGRLGNRKVTTGCKTCKIRRVKCDERKPMCLRCTKTGRICDGYELIFKFERPQCDSEMAKLVSHPPALALSPSVGTDEFDGRLIQFFSETCAPNIAGSIDIDFWTRLVPQLSHSEQAIRQAVVAIGALHLASREPKGDLTAMESENSPRRAHQFLALKSYNKAIRATITDIEQGRADSHLALVACVLFFCIECLQGHDHEALSIYQRGQILLANVEAGDSATGSMRGMNSAKLRSEIINIFSRVGLLSALHGTSPYISRQNDLKSFPSLQLLPTTIQSLSQARAELFQLMTETHGIVVMALKWRLSQRLQPADQNPVSPMTPANFKTLLDKRNFVQFSLGNWHRRFSTFSAARKSEDSVEDTINGSMLIVQHQIMSIWLACSLEGHETSYDDHFEDFQGIVNKSDSTLTYLQATGFTKGPIESVFTFDMGLIPPLFWTVIKCRQPRLRRCALSVLKKAPRQESLWDRDTCVKVAGRVIELEEGCLPCQDVEICLGTSPYEDEMLPAEAMRIQEVRIHNRSVEDNRRGQKVTYLRLQNVDEARWDVLDEYVSV